jgi:hypothetical protein
MLGEKAVREGMGMPPEKMTFTSHELVHKNKILKPKI